MLFALDFLAMIVFAATSPGGEAVPQKDDPTAIAALRDLGGELKSDGPGGVVTVLDLSSRLIDGSSLAKLDGLPNLRTLKVDVQGVPSAGWQAVGRLSRLETLDFGSSSIRDGDLENLRPLAQLQSLKIRSRLFDGTGLRHLKQLSRLQYADPRLLLVDACRLRVARGTDAVRGPYTFGVRGGRQRLAASARIVESSQSLLVRQPDKRRRPG